MCNCVPDNEQVLSSLNRSVYCSERGLLEGVSETVTHQGMALTWGSTSSHSLIKSLAIALWRIGLTVDLSVILHCLYRYWRFPFISLQNGCISWYCSELC